MRRRSPSGRAAAAAALAALSSTYADSAVKPVAANIEQADKLLTFAEAAAKKADAELAAGKPSEAAIAVRTAQASVGQVGQLFDAIDALVGQPRRGLGKARCGRRRHPVRHRSGEGAAAGREVGRARAGHRGGGVRARSKPRRPRATRCATARAASRRRTRRSTRCSSRSAMSRSASSARSPSWSRRSARRARPSRRPPSTSPPAAAGSATPPAPGSARPTGTSTQAISLSPTDPVAALAAGADRARARQQRPLAGTPGRRVVPEASRSYDNSVVSGGGDGADLGGLLGDLIFGGGGYRGGSAAAGRAEAPAAAVCSEVAAAAAATALRGHRGRAGSAGSSRSSGRSSGRRGGGGRF